MGLTLTANKIPSYSYTPITIGTSAEVLNEIEKGSREIIGKENIENFLKENKEKYNIEYTDEYVYLYLKTESELKPSTTIIDNNGEIILNIDSDPKDMNNIWIAEKSSDSCSCCGCISNYTEKKLQLYKKVLKVLEPSKFNFYKVKVLLKDIKKIEGLLKEVYITKMEIVNKMGIVPEISFQITDVEENGTLCVTITNSLTKETSPEFLIKVEEESEILPAIEKRLEEIHTIVELSETKGKISIDNLSSGLQKYINKGD